MGYYVHISVVMSCDENEPVAEVAKNYINTIKDCNEAKWYLQELSERKGFNPGPKGGLSLWGITGNYTCSDKFVECLTPFWKELFENEIGIFDFEHIIVFSEPEQRKYASCHEISWNKEKKEVEVKFHNLPFAWMQM